jgi:hypothetical protein
MIGQLVVDAVLDSGPSVALGILQDRPIQALHEKPACSSIVPLTPPYSPQLADGG